ncbi:tRNA (guanine-N(1)-)-methyltransferase [Clostridia bacterium]|nr:tRNA (guanine-N(1)-)-methyltransferase [Clostridia bacterium]
MLQIDVLTLFPEIIETVFSVSIVGRAAKNGFIEIKTHQIRDFAENKHNRVDDTPYGGGYGMIMMAEPIAKCFEVVCKSRKLRPHFIYMSPKGKRLDQSRAKKIATEYNNIAVLCGRYEGVDERLIDEFVDEQISIGDYVVTGGELPAMVLMDCVSRMVPGVLPNPECYEDESHYNGFLEYPHYTKPAIWRERAVPDVLLSGHHANIQEWKKSKRSHS